MSNFSAEKYHGRWSVYCMMSNTFSFIGKGRRWCERKARELNAYCGPLSSKEKQILHRNWSED